MFKYVLVTTAALTLVACDEPGDVDLQNRLMFGKIEQACGKKVSGESMLSNATFSIEQQLPEGTRHRRIPNTWSTTELVQVDQKLASAERWNQQNDPKSCTGVTYKFAIDDLRERAELSRKRIQEEKVVAAAYDQLATPPKL